MAKGKHTVNTQQNNNLPDISIDIDRDAILNNIKDDFKEGLANTMAEQRRRVFESVTQGVQNGILTRNEAREQLGYETIDGADSLLVPANLMPLNIASEDSKLQIFGYLEISSINVKQYVLSGTNENTLELGPGHYSSTALPGTGGNVGIAGHRTTYGAPFGDLDVLNIGDTILLTVDSKTYHYQVDSIDVVEAVGGEYVLFDRGDDRLTLTTCHPKYSAKERLIVSGILTKIEVIS